MVEIEIEFCNRLTNVLLKAKVEDVIGKMRPHQEFGGQVVDGAHVVPDVIFLGRKPPGQNPVAHRVGQSHEVISVGRGFGPSADNIEEIFENCPLQGRNAGSGAVVVFDDQGVSVG